MSFERRRTYLLNAADIPAALDLPAGSDIEAMAIQFSPLTLAMTVTNNDFDKVGPYEESPVFGIEVDPDSTVFAACVHGNEHGECVLADGHATRQSESVGAQPESAHINRWGQRWGVTSGG